MKRQNANMMATGTLLFVAMMITGGCGVAAPAPTGGGGGGDGDGFEPDTFSGDCEGPGTRDELDFINVSPQAVTVTIEYPNGTTCDQMLPGGGGASSLTITDTLFTVGETYMFSVGGSEPVSCVVADTAIRENIATISVNVQQAPTGTFVQISCTGNWEF